MECQNILRKISISYSKILEDNLVGIYVHGSIAFGCFHWERSDIDFLVVTKNPLSQSEKILMIDALLDLEGECPPKGLEMSVVLAKHCREFQYPTPFELHFSKAHIGKCKNDLDRFCADMHGTDRDLAAHITVLNAVGIALCGKQIHHVFGEVPRGDYIDSIIGDIENAPRDIVQHPVYTILNLCRVLAHLRDGLITSKEQGGIWGLSNLPSAYAPIIYAALQCYRSGTPFSADKNFLRQFSVEILKQIQAAAV